MPAGGISALWRIRALPAAPKMAMLTVSEEDDDMMQAQDAARRDRAANDLAAARILHEIAAAEDDLAPAAIVGHLDGAAAAADLDDGLQARDPPAAWRLHQGIAGVFHIAAPRRAAPRRVRGDDPTAHIEGFEDAAAQAFDIAVGIADGKALAPEKRVSARVPGPAAGGTA